MMETNKENAEALKTPKRSRRLSSRETLSHNERSVSMLPEIEELDGVSSTSNKMDPITPSRRSTRVIDSQTPSRSDAFASAHTPRRSCRKSIKPIQEYENIVAQKGLSAKRLTTDPSTSTEVEEKSEVVGEIKWEPSVIGRASTKRGKKAKRSKNKRLQRQKKIAEGEVENVQVEKAVKSDEEMDDHEVDDNDEKENVQIDHAAKEEVKSDEEMDDHKVDDNDEKENVQIDHAAKEEEEIDHNESEDDDEKESISKATESTNEVTGVKEEEIGEVQALSTEIPPPVAIQIDENVADTYTSDASMDEGDVVMSAMPVTADDCVESNHISAMSVTADHCVESNPEKQLQLSPKNVLLVSPASESANKSDDSDCIMLSLNDSSRQEQSTESFCPTPAVLNELKTTANESSDSLAINMPPLLICSDDEDDEEFVDALKNSGSNRSKIEAKNECVLGEPSEVLNATFDAEDEYEEEDNEKGEDSFHLVKSPEEIRKIVHGFEEEEDTSFLPEAKDEQMSSLNGTYDADEYPINEKSVAMPQTPAVANAKTPRVATPKSQVGAYLEIPAVATPKCPTARPSITRTPTPFKTKKPIVPDILVEPEDEIEDTPEVIMEPKDFTLKGSRKRSFSFCVDRPKKNVTFHSPSNTTMNIYHYEDAIKSSSKRNPTNITKRRKRSLSFTETEKELIDYMQLKKPIHGTPQKKLLQNSKIKMPNFSNIHQKQFQKMESISDHVARRAERAKILINSNTKVKPASVQKGIPAKNSVLRDQNIDGKKTHLQMPKARQRIDLSGHQSNDVTKSLHGGGLKIRSKSKQDLTTLEDGVTKMTSKISANSTSAFSGSTKQNNNTNNRLPKPKLNLNFSSSASVTFNSFATTNTAKTTLKTTIPSCGNTTISSLSKPRIHLPNPREHFNLSTTISATGRALPRTDKLEDRRKRIMEMFKARSTHRVGENNREFLRGVRTNRRFELQMMCRNRQI